MRVLNNSNIIQGKTAAMMTGRKYHRESDLVRHRMTMSKLLNFSSSAATQSSTHITLLGAWYAT